MPNKLHIQYFKIDRYILAINLLNTVKELWKWQGQMTLLLLITIANAELVKESTGKKDYEPHMLSVADRLLDFNRQGSCFAFRHKCRMGMQGTALFLL